MLPRTLTLMALGGCNAISGIGDLSFDQGGAGATSSADGGASTTAQTSTSTGSTSAGGSTASSTGATTSTTSSSSSSSAGAGAGGNPGCGNGAIDPPEECDDGNSLDGDGCSAACVVECGAGPGEEQDPDTHHCYLYLPAPGPWSMHESACESWRAGAKLAVVRNIAEASFIATANPALPQLWLGGTNRGSGSVFTWIDGEPFDYAPWESGQPNNPTVLACVALNGGTGFVDIPCDTTDVDGVCEYPLLP